MQRNLKTFNSNGIDVFAISYDSQETLREFAKKHDIVYPLLSDEGSGVIRDFGILNTLIPKDHERFGIPFPGTYMIGSDGLVFEKSFIAAHLTRESVSGMLQESFRVGDPGRGEVSVVSGPEFKACAYLASPTISPRQLTMLTVEISLIDGVHIYGRPLPDEYVPVELTLDGEDVLIVDRVDYPEPEVMYLEALDETLPVYTGRLKIKAHCMGVKRGQGEKVEVSGALRFQACDDSQCFLPQTITFPLSLQCLPFA